MKNKKTILLLTSGGLASALNATLYGAIKQARKLNYKILGGLHGWASLVQHAPIVDLTKLNIEAIKNRGGNFLRSSRTNPLKVPGGIFNLKEKIAKYKIDGIVAIGGNDTLGAAAKLFLQENIPIIGLPKTVDNDLPITYFSPGFPTAAYYAAKLTAETKEDSAYALSRVYIIEMYGADAGWLTCSTALGGADIVIPPEWQFDLADIIKLVKQKYEANGNYCVIALSKDAHIKGLKGILDTQFDGFGNIRQEFLSIKLKEKIENKLGLTTKIILPLNYFQSGEPLPLDWQMGIKLGQAGVSLIAKNNFGKACVVDYQKNKFGVKVMDLKLFADVTKKMNSSYFNAKKMLPTPKYFAYLNSMIGHIKFIDQPYQKLIDKINR
ncbi:MAG: 6-phosphofructokinase [Patescibacteria group bacterium]